MLWNFYFVFPSHFASHLTHPVSMTGWLPCSNSTHTTFAKHAAPKAAFTNADSPLTATTLSCFLGFHMPGHRLTTLGSLTKIPLATGRTSGSSTISPGTRSNIKFLLEENDLERNCWMLFDVPLQIKHYL